MNNLNNKNRQANFSSHFNGDRQRLEINSIHNKFLSSAHHCYLNAESARLSSCIPEAKFFSSFI